MVTTSARRRGPRRGLGRGLRFGIKTTQQHTTYDALLRVWREADTVPLIEHAWLFDHFVPLSGDTMGPTLEGWSILAALAAQTERLRLGLMVTGATYRHPAVLAKIGAAVDHISHGRLDLGIGAGWHEGEHTMYGLPFYTPGERIRRLGEACEVIKRLWTEPLATFDGRYYRLTDATCEPKPVQQPYPPFVIGGSGEQLTLRVVARHATIWNFADGSAEQFAHKSAVLDEHCAAVGRDPDTIERSIQIRVTPDDLGSAREALRPYIAAGATHIVLRLAAPYPDGIAQRLADEIAAPLHAAHEDQSLYPTS